MSNQPPRMLARKREMDTSAMRTSLSWPRPNFKTFHTKTCGEVVCLRIWCYQRSQPSCNLKYGCFVEIVLLSKHQQDWGRRSDEVITTLSHFNKIQTMLPVELHPLKQLCVTLIITQWICLIGIQIEIVEGKHIEIWTALKHLTWNHLWSLPSRPKIWPQWNGTSSSPQRLVLKARLKVASSSKIGPGKLENFEIIDSPFFQVPYLRFWGMVMGPSVTSKVRWHHENTPKELVLVEQGTQNKGWYRIPVSC